MIFPVMVEAGYTARVEVKSAVVVQVGSGDPADNAQDWEIVANDDDCFFGRVAPHNST